MSSDHSYSSVKSETTMNNGKVPGSYHPPRRQIPPPIIPLPSQTSESTNFDSPPAVSSNNINSNSLTQTPPSQVNTPQTPNNNQWRHKLNNLKQSFQSVGTPRFHRRPKVLCKYNRMKSMGRGSI